jgi:hypothetical protein
MFKKFLPFSFAIALCGMVIVGCEEDVVAGDEPAMKAEVDGDDWETSSVTAIGSNSVVITGANSDSSSITITIPGDAEVNTHSIGVSSGFLAAYVTTGNQTMGAFSGDITVSTINDTEIAGQFEFMATNGSDTIEIEDGVFYAKRN